MASSQCTLVPYSACYYVQNINNLHCTPKSTPQVLRSLPTLARQSPLVLRAESQNTSKYERNPHKYWEHFYNRHHNKFFKDRHYLEKDWGRYFSVLDENGDRTAPARKKVVLEVGCGVGNTLFPLLDAFPGIFVHACDFSPRAISLIKANGSFKPERVNAFISDVTIDDLVKEISSSSVDVVTLIFTMSAVSPKRMPLILENIRSVLKPKGYVLFRDYAIGDFAQEKHRGKNQMISENFYVRGDGTCAFYFAENLLSEMFKECGFNTVEVNVYSKRIENHSRKVVMERRWIRGVFCNAR